MFRLWNHPVFMMFESPRTQQKLVPWSRREFSGMIHWLSILVGGFSPTPLKNDGVSSSVGVMTFPTEWKVIRSSQQPPATHPFPTFRAPGYVDVIWDNPPCWLPMTAEIESAPACPACCQGSGKFACQQASISARYMSYSWSGFHQMEVSAETLAIDMFGLNKNEMINKRIWVIYECLFQKLSFELGKPWL